MMNFPSIGCISVGSRASRRERGIPPQLWIMLVADEGI